MSANSPQRAHYRIGLMLLPDFNSLAMNAFLDPFRAANYLLGEKIYHWAFLSLEGGNVSASNQMHIANTQRYTNYKDDLNALLVNASWAPERFQQPQLKRWLRTLHKNGVLVGGMDTGAFVLGYAGVLKNQAAVVHYEHSAAFQETFPSVEYSETLFTLSSTTFSCCGGTAAIDMALELIRQRNGIEVASATARYVFKERLREGTQAQVPDVLAPVGYQLPTPLREIILLMERNIEEPLSQSELSEFSALSVRQIQRLFKEYLGVTPLRYYLNARLDQARGLVTQTEIPISEVSMLCGFSHAAELTRAYKTRFGVTPSGDRKEGRIPFQLRNFTGHSSYYSIR